MNQTPWVLLLLLFVSTNAKAQSWNTFRNDSGRSGFVEAEFDPGFLQHQWTWTSVLPPEPAWDGPARWDAFAELKDLPAMRQYDGCFHPVSDGQRVYFGSSSQDTLFAIEADSGKPVWAFVSGGPIRIAPTIHNDKILFGSDDGFVYCLNKLDGTLNWKFNPSLHASAEQRRVINNDRLISFFPVRTGIVVRDDVAYFAASFLPWRESYLCGIDIETGKPDQTKKNFITKHSNATLEGPLLIAEDRLILPQGRIAPLMFDRHNGSQLGSLPGGGGVTIVVTEKGNVARAEGGRAARGGQVGVFRGKERVATFPRGRSIVVREDAFYVIDRDKVLAAGRKANELLWQRKFIEPLEIIMVGSSLVVGGKDSVEVIDSQTGKALWRTTVNGRVFGLAFSNSRLLASTDTGQVICFQANGKERWKPEAGSVPVQRNLIPVPPEKPATQSGLLHRWVFHRSAIKSATGQVAKTEKLTEVSVADQRGNVPLNLAGRAKSIAVGESQIVEAINLEQGMFPIDEKHAVNLPTKNITLESWVRVDQTATWGGIVGCIQDDGSTEHGWLLGFNGDRFSLAIAGGGNGLTYLKSNQPFQKGHWYHVAGTYDGQEMKLFVNGQLAASSQAEKGEISYAQKRFFTVGAYRDANESFPLNGGLHEVRIYNRVLTPANIKSHYEKLQSEFPTPKSQQPELVKDSFLDWGPYLRFVRPGQVEISFGTKEALAPAIKLDLGNDNTRLITSKQKQTEHRLLIDKLPFKRILDYQILKTSSDSETGPSYPIDTHFDWSVTARSAEKLHPLLRKTSNPIGLVVLIGAEHKTLAEKLSLTSDLTIVLAIADELEAQKIRQQWILNEELQYGKRLSVSTEKLEDFPAAAAQIVVIPKAADKSAAAKYKRLVRPNGGVLSDGTNSLWERGKIQGAGEWTHMYGLTDNSAYGGEHLSEVSNREDLVASWIGRPGPRYQTDRQNRKPSPLAANGRLFLQGQQRMIALDSYSGHILWSVESPTVMRWNVPRDSANWCADADGIFVAAEKEAWWIDGAKGNIRKKFQIPDVASQRVKPDGKAYWGFIARHKNLLLGTAVQPDAIYTKWWGKTQWFDTPTGGDTHLVAGDALFALEKKSGDVAWIYNGLVLHPTITILDERIYFVEDKTAAHLENRTRRISLDKDQTHELICLDSATGQLIFRKPLPSFGGKVSALYLAGGGATKLRSLVMVASEATKSEFLVTCLDPSDGKAKWNRAVKWEANHHGKHISRPAIENDLVYLRPEVLKLTDGETIKRGFPSGHGCASYTLSKNGLFSRLGETTWWDVRNDKVNRFSRVRTDCWISAIPAQGMLLSAEGGGGCSCGSWLETSIGFLPRNIDHSTSEMESEKN